MGLLGKLLSLPFEIVNAPVKAVEDVVADILEEEGIKDTISKPLSKLSEELKKVGKDGL